MNRIQTRVRRPATLRQWRSRRKWTMQRAAEFLGISTSAYSRLEMGQQSIKGDLARDICDKTRVPLGVLVGVIGVD